jgi:hypothetical protein
MRTVVLEEFGGDLPSAEMEKLLGGMTGPAADLMRQLSGIMDAVVDLPNTQN